MLVWVIALIFFIILEACTATLVSIWFVVGAAAAMIATWLGAKIWLQITVFVVISIIALILTKPFVKKVLNKNIVPTNADRVFSSTAKVTETIDNANSVGAVYVDGKTWSARSEDNVVIPEGTQVSVVRMEGVKLFVKTI